MKLSLFFAAVMCTLLMVDFVKYVIDNPSFNVKEHKKGYFFFMLVTLMFWFLFFYLLNN